MPFLAETYLDSLSEQEIEKYFATYTLIGHHPDTTDYHYFAIPTNERFAGMYILGVQGSGKSSLLENIIFNDIDQTAVIVVDPHGDLIDHVIGQLRPEDQEDFPNVFLFDMLDEAYPFGVNVFSGKKHQTTIAQTQAVDRVMHIFEVLWGDVLSQQNLPRYLRAAIITLFSNPGATLVDMYDFLLNDGLREEMLANVTDPTIKQFWEYQYNSKPPSVRVREISPLINRLESLFMGRSLVRNIVGQGATSIDFRAAIENKEVLLIKLPLKTLPQDARLIGAMLISQIHAAIFSFADLPQEKRPGFSLIVDEFQHFATTDFSEMFTEGRKFGARVTLAHQFRDQIPDTLKSVRSAMMTARTKICFQTTPEDGREMARLFETAETEVLLENIDPMPCDYLLTYSHDDPDIKTFIDWYLRPLQSMKKAGRIEVTTWKVPIAFEFTLNLMGSYIREKPKVLDPEPYLNNLLYQVMKTQNCNLPIHPQVIEGFSNCGKGFYITWDSLKKDVKAWYTSSDVSFPKELLVETADHGLRWQRAPKNSDEQFFHFIFFLRRVMFRLSYDPIGQRTTRTPAQIAQMLNSLPERAAFVRSGEDIATIFTDDTLSVVPTPLFQKRLDCILAQTHKKYCKPRAVAEQETSQHEAWIDQIEEEQEHKEEEVSPQPQLAPKNQIPVQIPASIDTMNILYAQMRGREIDTDTTILASLGEHYVLTIRQWMRLFEWGSYPRATQYFKELRENGWIYRKDREGRGGKLVEGDWFFLLTKGANELTKRKQPAPLFTLEPNEAERASGDTLVHTSLVNEILIHLRLLERSHANLLKIDQIDHERSMRRTYLAALSDSKLYPDGFLRLLVPTQNGLKRRYTFLELQHTTQRDEANWKSKCRKYLALFERADMLERVFSSRTPNVLVITLDSAYALHCKKWTEEVLAERGERGRAYTNRFTIGAYDTGISDMSIEPLQFFCMQHFYTPFRDSPHALFRS